MIQQPAMRHSVAMELQSSPVVPTAMELQTSTIAPTIIVRAPEAMTIQDLRTTDSGYLLFNNIRSVATLEIEVTLEAKRMNFQFTRVLLWERKGDRRTGHR